MVVIIYGGDTAKPLYYDKVKGELNFRWGIKLGGAVLARVPADIADVSTASETKVYMPWTGVLDDYRFSLSAVSVTGAASITLKKNGVAISGKAVSVYGTLTKGTITDINTAVTQGDIISVLTDGGSTGTSIARGTLGVRAGAGANVTS